MWTHLRVALVMFFMLTVLTGIVYPALVTAVAQVAFPHQAQGSLIYVGGNAVGSELIGQPFSSPAYFWGRPSATSPVPYNAAASGGSNFGPLNPGLKTAVAARVATLRKYSAPNAPVPVDLVTASGSGLDPHISLAAAEYQVTRVAKARIMSEEELRALVRQCTEGPQLGLFGEPRVNVLRLNLALDQKRPADATRPGAESRAR